MKYKYIIIILFLSILHLTAHANPSSQDGETQHERIEVFFRRGQTDIERGFKKNQSSLSRLSSIIDSINSDALTTILKIEVESFASPEGGVTKNDYISKKRSVAMIDYLVNTKNIDKSIISANSIGIAWDKLEDAVVKSKMRESYKTGVLYIIRNVPEETRKQIEPNQLVGDLVDSRLKHLMEYKWGYPFRWMDEHLFPDLRSATAITITYRSAANIMPPILLRNASLVSDSIMKALMADSAKIDLAKLDSVAKLDSAAVEEEDEDTVIPKPLFAFKTNLLYDALSAINVELEIPIGKRWSIAGEYIFPWWIQDNGKIDSKRNRLQILSGNVEGKIWFGKRDKRPVMTGWYAGLYVGGGIFDIEYNAKGYQGEFFIAGGLSAGYAHKINKKGSLRMEYSIGVGYMQTNYRYYEAFYSENHECGISKPHNWHPVRKYYGRYTWIGPTKAKISFVWMLNYKKKVKKSELEELQPSEKPNEDEDDIENEDNTENSETNESPEKLNEKSDEEPETIDQTENTTQQ